MDIEFKRFGNHKMPLPKRGSVDAAGIDLYAAVDARLKVNEPVAIPTGWGVRIPYGHVGLCCSRSGLASKEGIFVLNSPGVIDSDYRGEIFAILNRVWVRGKQVRERLRLKDVDHFTYPDLEYEVNAGDRIAQLVIVPCFACLPGSGFGEFVPQEVVEFYDTTDRGERGLGSTGV